MSARTFVCMAVVLFFASSMLLGSAAAKPRRSDELKKLDQGVVRLIQAGKYAEAAESGKRAVAIAEHQFGTNDARVAGALSRLAEIYLMQGHYADAEPLCQRALAIAERTLGPEHPDVATALSDLGTAYHNRGRDADAEPLFKRALAIREKVYGPDDVSVAASLANLVLLYAAKGRHADAKPLDERILKILEKKLGPEHPSVVLALINLAGVHKNLRLYADAEPLFTRALAIQEKTLGRDHPDVATTLDNLATVYQNQSLYTEAEPLFKRALTIREKTLGADELIGSSLFNLATLYANQGRFGEAEPLFKRCLAVREKALGKFHPDVAVALNGIATAHVLQGRFDEAEPLLKRSLAIEESVLGPDHTDVATALYLLATVYQNQGRFAEAEPIFQRSLSIKEKVLGTEHPDVAAALNNLALLYMNANRYVEAEPLVKRSLSILEKVFGSENRNVATSLNNLAVIYENQNRLAEAEPLSQRTLAIKEKALGPEHTEVGTALNNLARLYVKEDRFSDAEPLYQRALAIKERALGPDHPEVSTALDNLAGLYFAQRDWARAADFGRRATAVLIRRTQRGTDKIGEALSGKRPGDAQQLRSEVFSLVKATSHIMWDGGNTDTHLSGEMFQTSQWALASEAARSLSQMAARAAKVDAGLGDLVRERQDLVAEWQKRDQARSVAVSQAPDKRDRAAEAENVARLDAIDARIALVDKRLIADFPDYAALANPTPSSIADVQAQLGEDEALVMFLDTSEDPPTPEETFIWVVTKTNMRWVKSDLGTPGLTREVAALRCGLDYDGTWGAAGSRCSELLKINYTEIDHRDGRPLPFDLGRAHTLYKALFGQVEDLIKSKHLLIVPSGALTQLPFQVLITDKPDPTQGEPADFRHVAWLVLSHALTVLPSVSSLKALRQLAKDSRASRTLIGFGNPLLDGPDASYAKWAANARSKESCPPEAPKQRIAALAVERRGVLPLTVRGGLVDVAQIRFQVPLPETADELCAVARDLGVGGDEMRIGTRATETEIKRLSAAGELSKYRLIHFATHGALAGQIGDGSEPGLLLTPPKTATELDDGYLSASEVAALKLDADWVILSACNTAAGGAEGAEALSGLARAFFFAGARALLVSHWAVYSDATVKLITGAVGRMAADKSVGRAEAMRQSMLALIEKGTADETHPAFWAPFIVVGEGAAAK